MNILVLSCGTRNKIIQYFRKELSGRGLVIATDCSNLAPALYDADKFYIVPKINEAGYLNTILDICKSENIKGIFSLIDPELCLLSKNRERFLEIGTIPIVSNYDVVEICFNKMKMFEFCNENLINTVPTFLDILIFKKELENEKVAFPVFVKPVTGSGSIKIQKVDNLEDLEQLCERNKDLIIQPFMTGQEYGVDLYTDIITRKVVSIFVKKKLLMRAGETDKSISVKNEKIFAFVKDFVEKLDIIGNIDIDIFEQGGELYISEVNPRFGGGYPHAYECGINFLKFIVNNLNGKINKDQIGNYDDGVYMMKYSEIMIKRNL